MAWVRDRADQPASTGGRGVSRWLVCEAVRGRFALRAATVIGVCGAAYHYSLTTLLAGVGAQAPLAGLGLLPAVALLIAAASGPPATGEPDIHDRYLDYILGIPLLVGALVIVVVLPVVLAAFFWFWRLDLISLPLFVAGSVALCFGSRALWRLRFAIVLLALACPAPYVLLAGGGAHALARPSLAVLRLLLTVLPLAQPVAPGGGSLFVVAHGAQHFVLRVESAGAGVDGVLAFLLVGVPVAALVRGRAAARVAWLLAGAAAVWALSVAWLVAYFGAGRAWGEGFAAGVLNQYVGLAVFDLGLLGMLAALPVLGLRFDLPGTWRSIVEAKDRSVGPAVERVVPSVAILLVAGLVAGAANEGLRQFQLVEQPTGQPLLDEGAVLTHPVSGWSIQPASNPPWVAGAAGRDADWKRYEYLPNAGPSGPAAPPVVMDIVATSTAGALAGHGVERVYPLHAYRLVESREVGLGGGVIGHSIVYRSRYSSAAWVAVYWEWPVQTQGGIAYERVVLGMSRGSDSELYTRLPAPAPAPDARTALVDALSGSAVRSATPAEARSLGFLAGFGRQVVLAGARVTA
ncbi:MAG TPA: hypothetical protein VGO86_00515 [Candidatus Dormibacteraeota bacterium]